ncbi:perforin-1-like [Tiliqua scincoides]|uniref:perforin-1-like n=1 Tax=Tiliqua scincoides TaxID=71010 RepID=UPI003461A002
MYDLMDLRKWQIRGCTLCENPLVKVKRLQKLPLAVTAWKANISCQQKVQHSAPKSVISEVREEAAPAGRPAQIDTQSLLMSRFGIDKDKSVSEDFKNKVKLLPEKYDSNSKLRYYHLIRSYGTHFITELDLGVGVRILTALPVCKIRLEGFTVSEISQCLEIEVGKIIGFGEVTKDPDFQKCKETLKNLTGRWLSKDQLRLIQGGQASERSPFFRTGFDNDPKRWLENSKYWPGLLSYSLEPLHTLVNKSDPRRDSLQHALSEYVRERALWRNCTHSCPPGVQQSAWDPCSCECPNNNFTNSMCCPQQRGLGKLTVTIESASGLWGDYITGSDSYVKVLFKDKLMCTPTVWNSNHPEWNANFDFGIIQVQEDFSELELQVWDQDFGWDDDLLGRCFPSLSPWNSTTHFCYLNHGRLNYRYHLACGPHLGGSFCWDYILPWMNKKKILSQVTVKENFS